MDELLSDDFNIERMKQSQFMDKVRKTKSQKPVTAYEPDIIEKTMHKSYLRKMARRKRLKRRSSNIKKDKQEQQKRVISAIKKITINNKTDKVSKTNKEIQNKEFRLIRFGDQQTLLTLNCKKNHKQPQKVMIRFNDHAEIQFCDTITNKVKYSFNFNTIKAKVKEPKQSISEDGFILKFNQSMQFLIECPKDFNAQCIVKNQIKAMTVNSDGISDNLTDLYTSNDKFYEKKYKTAIQFAQNCQTGDILLFEGSHLFGKLQRWITCSDYDHIAMVFKDPVYGILLFESTSSSGVCLTPWSYMIKQEWFDAIEKIVWRKLQGIQRDKDFHLLTHQFVKANIGKNYFVSFDKLIPFSRDSYVAKKQEEVGFFCSELIAKIYKDLGLLSKNKHEPGYKASNNFYPYHFSKIYQLNLLKGCLSNEYDLYFNKKRLKEYYQ